MKILGFSGRKQSGKTSSTNFLIGMEMRSLGLIEDFSLRDNGDLEVPVRVEDSKEIQRHVFNWSLPNPTIINFLADNLWPTLKAYSLADPLKYDICMGLFGMSYEQCFGTDEDKNTPTRLCWENVPGIISKKDIESIKNFETSQGHNLVDSIIGIPGEEWEFGLSIHEPGPMTAREVMQHIGTDIFRRMLPDIWIETTLRRIHEERPELAIITDVRFPNEVEGIQKAGGKVIRLTLDPHNSQHQSETALDNYQGFDAIIDNSQLTIHEKNIQIYKTLKEWSFLEYELTIDNN